MLMCRVVHSFSLLCSVALCEYSTVYLSILYMGCLELLGAAVNILVLGWPKRLFGFPHKMALIVLRCLISF